MSILRNCKQTGGMGEATPPKAGWRSPTSSSRCSGLKARTRAIVDRLCRSTIHVPEVRPGRNAAMDPARRRHLRHQVARLLDVLLQNGDHGSILLGKELLRHRAALLAHAHLLRVLKEGLQVLVAPAAGHVRNGQEGSRLGPR
jgi:hypothetical protein